MPLPDWLALHTYQAVWPTIDAPMPWDIPPEPEPVAADVVAAAEQFLREHSAMRETSLTVESDDLANPDELR